ncbi:DNA polymerase sigma-like protein [Leishmania donovani]|uniref:Cid1 poly A polymerase family protein n=1 Tax=Leishmania donovani TaxID=5661 RepID=A0A3Q8IDQ5_LEIDO|nr:DNA polymerase sigma-like protein [Leishmania donovani]AYU79648.1 DNA polymerase sigma-like protein [Leishmania donovani]TPP41098.1 Cid1 poly A polymerase family protein [Leishmania donovani]CBZ34937.1 DNA polymerase sigma-like protein [Leishmania donovani]
MFRTWMNPEDLASLDRAIERTITHQLSSSFAQPRTRSTSYAHPAPEGHPTQSSSDVPAPLPSSLSGDNAPPHFFPYNHPSRMPAARKEPHTPAGGPHLATPHGQLDRTPRRGNMGKAAANVANKLSPHPARRDDGKAMDGRHPRSPHNGRSDVCSSRTHGAPRPQANRHHGSRRRRSSDSSADDEDGHRSIGSGARRPRTETDSVLVAAALGPSPVLSSSLGISCEIVQSLIPPSSLARCILAFDAKLIELLYCLSPTSEDRETKLRVIDDIRTTMQRAGMDIQIYGSLCTGLVIPASDVDCVLMRSGDEQIASAMSANLSCAMLTIASAATGSVPPKSLKGPLSTAVRIVAERMRKSQSFIHVTSIAHAKVPIVKCRHRRDDVKVDLSFEQSGCVSSNYLCELLCAPGNEMARPLIVLVKALVNNCGLDEPSMGGLGSFPISLLVLWYLQQCVRTRFSAELQRSIGALLAGFLKYYGTEFDFRRLGIDYVQQKTFTKPPADELYIVNPIRPETNCAKAATLFATRVMPLFQRASATFVGLLDANASPATMESQLLHYFAKATSDVRNWRDVSRRAAREPHLVQNMWDAETNMYVGGVL